MNNQMSRAELVAYARAENIANHFGAPSEALDTLGDLLAYIGNEMYRPVTRLMLQNWNQLNDRIEHFTPEEWILSTEIANKEGLDKKAVALLIEVLEGVDTPIQEADGKRTEMNELEKQRLQEHIEKVRAEEAAMAQAEAERLMREEGK